MTASVDVPGNKIIGPGQHTAGFALHYHGDDRGSLSVSRLITSRGQRDPKGPKIMLIAGLYSCYVFSWQHNRKHLSLCAVRVSECSTPSSVWMYSCHGYGDSTSVAYAIAHDAS